ncbi:hypothetical protein [Stappia indica]|uniref:AcrIC5-like domain-containing protein n=1 Tax=Stappia indica TaxID=538381 RepID=A0A857C4W9_9HYPH|nr:hypothetical protein [Stappia indica]QGZ33928.1 hypothetical protein GH266_05025 [Stappia indica]
MTKITNQHGAEFDMDAVANLMDDDIREALHSQGFDSDQAFFEAYCRAHAELYGEEFTFATRNPQA